MNTINLKHDLVHWVLNIGILMIFLLLALFGETFLLNEYVFIMPPLNVSLEMWLALFRQMTLIDLGCVLLVFCFWYLWGTFFVSFRDNREERISLVWWVLLVLLLGVVFVSGFLTPAQEGAWLVYILYAFNTVGYYYFATVLCSPVAIKYYPPGAKYLRGSW